MPLILSAMPVRADSAVEWVMFIPGENPRYDESNNAIMVSGIEHNLTFYIGNSDAVTVSLRSSDIVGEENYTNSYLWKYSEGVFSDVLYGAYINLSSSSVFSDKIAFHIGVHAKAKEGTWRLLVERTVGGIQDTIIDENVILEKADPRLGLSTPLFEFRVEPFESGDRIPPTVKDYRFTTTNAGNVPLWLVSDYSKMGEIFYTTNMSIVLHPGDSVKHAIYLTSLPWSPQVFTVEEYVRGTAMHMITADMVSFIPSFRTVVKINVKVVRQGFNILDIGPAKLQYEKGPKVADFDDVLDLRLFLSGDADTYLTISVNRLEMLSVYSEGVWHNNSDTSQTLNFQLSNDSDEIEVLIRIRCYREDTSARVSYYLSSEGKSDSAYTDIVVGKAPYVPPPPDEKNGINMIALIGVIIVMAFVGLFLVYYTKKIKEEDEEGDMEDGGANNKKGEKSGDRKTNRGGKKIKRKSKG